MMVDLSKLKFKTMPCDTGPKINHFKTVQLKGDMIVFIDQRWWKSVSHVDGYRTTSQIHGEFPGSFGICGESLKHGNLTMLTVVINSDISSTHQMHFLAERSDDDKLL